MQPCRWMLLIWLALYCVGCRQAVDPANHAPGWELKPPASDAVPVSASEKMPGIYPVGTALGGFGPCDNYPKDLGERDWGVKGAISLIAFPGEPVAYFKHRGIALRVVNRTGEVASFAACDSRLFLVREAVDQDGRWRAVETPPGSSCGNSFHRVALKSDQYWEFPARRYSGPIKTSCRCRPVRGTWWGVSKAIQPSQKVGRISNITNSSIRII